MRHPRTVSALVLGLLLVAAGSVRAARYEIQPGQDSEIVFTSKALWEKFDGKTKGVSGYLEADLQSLQGEVRLEVAVDLASFDTGMKKRNQHMRENHLETGIYPQAFFRGARILKAEPVSLAPGATARVVLAGTLDLHGVQKEYEVALEVERRSDGALRIRGEFPVMLPDHEIERPQKLVVKLAEKQEVKLDLLAVPQP